MRTALAVTLVLVVAFTVVAAEEQAPRTVYQKGMALYNEARKLQTERKYEDALAAWLKLADEYPNHQYAEAALNTAASLARQVKQYDKSVALYQRLLEAMPKGGDKGTIYYAVGSLYYGPLQDFAKGVEWYEKAALEPGYNGAAVALWQGIYCASRAKDNDKVISMTDMFLKTFTNKGSYAMQALSYTAQAQVNKGDLDAVPATLERMSEIAPDDLRIGAAWYALGTAWRVKKDAAKSAEAYLKAADIASYDRAASCLLSAGDTLAAEKPEEALAAYRRYIDEHPKGQFAHEVYVRMARVCQRNLKDRAKEAAVCEEFLGKFEKSVYRDDILMALGYAAATLEDGQDKAIDAYTKVVENQTASNQRPTAMLNLAHIYRAKADNDNARKYYQMMIDEYPGWQVADNAARELAALK